MLTRCVPRLLVPQMKVITTLAWVTSGFVLVLFGLPVLVAVCAIGSYTLAGNNLDSATVRPPTSLPANPNLCTSLYSLLPYARVPGYSC